MFMQMSIFKAPSTIITQEQNSQFVQPGPLKQMSDATSAIRESYIATNHVLGVGSYGKVFLFKSRNVEPAKDFAVKVLLKEIMSESAIMRLREEISVLSQLDHPNIIKYIESFEDHRYMYIVTEYMPNSRDLSQILTQSILKEEKKSPKETFLPMSDVQNLMRMILVGLSHIHANDIVHRDIKPANCLLDDN